MFTKVDMMFSSEQLEEEGNKINSDFLSVNFEQHLINKIILKFNKKKSTHTLTRFNIYDKNKAVKCS